MKKQALVIGLGQFGMAVARALATRQVEVLAVDVDDDRVRQASAFATEAVCLDATDEAALGRTAPERRDVCLCAIGDDAKEASILCTALLKQMGASHVIARSESELHARILILVGADLVVNPERQFGERFVNQMLHRQVHGEMPLGAGLLVSELSVPAAFVGQSLSALKLPRRFGVTVVAIREGEAGAVVMPTAETRLSSNDVLVVVAREGAVSQMMDEG